MPKPIKFRQFIWLCLEETWKTSWEKADTLATVAGVALGAITHYVPRWESAMSNLVWQIPIACLAVVTLTRLLLSPYLVYGRRDLAASAAEQAIEQMNKPAVKIGRVLTQKRNWSNGSGMLYSVEVFHAKGNLTVQGVKVSLTEIQPPAEQMPWLPVTLHKQHDNPQASELYHEYFSLNPNDRTYVDLVQALDRGTSFDVWHIVPDVNRLLPIGDYLLTLTVTGRDIPANSATFHVWAEDGVLQCSRITESH